MPVTFAGANIWALGASVGLLVHAFSNRVRKVKITRSARVRTRARRVRTGGARAAKLIAPPAFAHAHAQGLGRSRSRPSLAATRSSGGMASASAPRRRRQRSSPCAWRRTRRSSSRPCPRRCPSTRQGDAALHPQVGRAFPRRCNRVSVSARRPNSKSQEKGRARAAPNRSERAGLRRSVRRHARHAGTCCPIEALVLQSSRPSCSQSQ